MRFYVSKCHDKLNRLPYVPEEVTQFLCLNPYYPVTLKKRSHVRFIIDSGAFQDVGNESRLTYEEALKRQLKFERKFGTRKAEALVSYDRLVDEQFTEEKGQIKMRVSNSIADDYVDETIGAAEFIASKRDKLSPRKLILSCQGVTTKQYLYCLDKILEVSEPEDIIGFGGFCIISKSKEYEKQFYEVIREAFPKIVQAGISRVHIFGLGMFRPLIQTDVYARLNGLECSYDTSSPELNGAFGRVFNPFTPSLAVVYEKVHKNNGYKPRDLAIFNIRAINNFWDMHGQLPLPDNDFTPSYTPRKKMELNLQMDGEAGMAIYNNGKSVDFGK